MPELPEVETIRRELEPLLIGRRIRSVAVERPDIVGCPEPDEFGRHAVGRRVESVGRRGKYLVVQLDRELDMVFHMRLSGHIQVRAPGRPPPHERVRIVLTGRRVLSFVEPRALGRVWLVDRASYPDALRGMQHMGPEPTTPEFNSRWLGARLAGRKASVKSLLLDQRICCGAGNIYTDEALFRAGVRPTRPGGSLTGPEVAKLTRGMKDVIRAGIRWCGTTLSDGRYRRPGTQTGSFQRHLRVHGRDGNGCRRRGCGGTVRRIRIGSRSSYFCPECQT